MLPNNTLTPQQQDDQGQVNPLWFNKPIYGNIDGAHALPDYNQNNDLLKQLLQGQTPFASNDWNGLIQQLQNRANGTGPSLAQQNYNMANQNTVNSIASMARGSASPGASQEAMIQMGRQGQGQAAGLALAGTQEQQAATEGLSKALMSRDSINNSTYMGLLGQKLGLNQGEGSARLGQQQINNQSSANQFQSLASLAGLIAMLAA